MDRGSHDAPDEGLTCNGLDDPKLDELLPASATGQLREEVEMARGLCPDFDLEAFLGGTMTPVYFGSAVNNFGVRELLGGVARYAPQPRPQSTKSREVMPKENKVSAFVFKIQANMDPKHRDRIAFARICSGHFKRGAKLKHVRSGKIMNIHNPVMFLAQDREIASEAWPGDIIGIPNHGNLRIGDALTEGEDLQFSGIPSFAPELLQRVRPTDPLRAKHLEKAIVQLAEEGAVKAFKTRIGGSWIVGVVGALQFEVLADRLRSEYDVPMSFETAGLYTARWLESSGPAEMKKFIDANQGDLAEDHDNMPVFMARNGWHLQHTAENWPKITFLKVKEQMA